MRYRPWPVGGLRSQGAWTEPTTQTSLFILNSSVCVTVFNTFPLIKIIYGQNPILSYLYSSLGLKMTEERVSMVGATGWHEKGNNNGVIREGQPSKQPVFLWEHPVLTAVTLSLPADL